MIITVIVFQRINSVLPNKSMPYYRKSGLIEYQTSEQI